MASAIPKPAKRLGEFLKEQQEPFILEVYLFERGYLTKPSPHGSEKWAISSVLNKKKENLYPFSKALTTLHKKLAFHNQSCTVIRDSDTINEHVDVSFPLEEATSTEDQTIVETDRFSFSTTTSSTVYNSCSDIDEDGSSLSPHKDNPLFSLHTCQASRVNNMPIFHQSQQATTNEKHHQRCLQVSVTHENEDVAKIRKTGSSRCVVIPKKITDDSLLLAAIWSSLIQSAKKEKCNKEWRELLVPNPNVCGMLKSKTLLWKAKQVVFDYVKEIRTNVWRKEDREKGYKEISELRRCEELGKVIWERTKGWCQEGGKETRLRYLLSLDYLNSMDEWSEWSEFKLQIRHICVEIADAILERLNNEIVSDIIQILAPTFH